MFERFIFQLFADYLNAYVKNIQWDQIRVGIWNGVAVLENVEIRLEALDYLQLPFAIKQGFIGKLKLEVPWKKLGWEPVVITLEDLFICACPRDEFEWNATALETRDLAAKKAQLAASEFVKLSAKISKAESDDNTHQSFLSYLSAKIFDNIQVTIRNAHFRYCDQLTNPGVAFSFGITFSELTVNPVDTSGQTGISAGVKAKESQVQKQVDIKELAVYWNSKEGNTESLLKCSLTSQSHHASHEEGDGINYLCRPFNASIHIMVNKPSLFDVSNPKYTVLLYVHNLVVTLEDSQLHEMILLWDAMSTWKLREKYGRVRPSVGQPGYSRKDDGWERMWWNFAIQAVLIDVRKKVRRSSWCHVRWCIEKRRQYVNLYKAKLKCLLEHKPGNDKCLSALEELEKELDLEEILSFRSIAESRLQIDDIAPAISEDSVIERSDSPNRRSWLNLVTLGMLGAEGSTVSEQLTGLIPDDVIQDIYKATEYEPASFQNNLVLPKGYCHAALTVNMDRVILNFRISNPVKDLLEVNVQSVHGTVKMWQESVTLCFNFCHLDVVDRYSSHSAFPIVVKPKFCSDGSLPSHSKTVSPSPSDPIDPFLVLEIEFLSGTSDYDVKFKVSLQPLQFVYSSELIQALSKIFRYLSSLQTHQDLVLLCLDRLENSKARIMSKAEYISAMRKRYSLEVCLLEPVVILPESIHRSDGLLLVFSMSSIQITSLDPPKGCSLMQSARELQWLTAANDSLEGAYSITEKGNNLYHSRHNPEMSKEEVAFMNIRVWGLYDRFKINAANVKVVVSQQPTMKEKCWDPSEAELNLNLVADSKMETIIGFCLLPNEPALTHIQIDCDIFSFRLSLSSTKYEALLSLFSKLSEESKQNDQSYMNEVSEARNAKVESCCPLEGEAALSPRDRHKSFGSEESCFKAAKFAMFMKSTSLLIELCSDDGTDNIRTLWVYHLDDARLTFTEFDSWNELQVTASNICMQRFADPFNKTFTLLIYSKGYSMASLMKLQGEVDQAHSGTYSFGNSNAHVFEAAAHSESANSKSLKQIPCPLVNHRSFWSGQQTKTSRSYFSLGELVLSIVVPGSCSEQVLPTTPYSSNVQTSYNQEGSSSDSSVNRKVKGEDSIHIFCSARVDSLVYESSEWALEGIIATCELNWKDPQGLNIHSSPLMVLSKIEIQGRYDADEYGVKRVSVEFQLDKMQVWCTHATINCLKSFNFERFRTQTNPSSALRVKVSGILKQVLMTLNDGRWNSDAALFELCLQITEVTVKWSKETSDFTFSCDLEVNYHNMQTVAWEPFLEPWHLDVEITRSLISDSLPDQIYSMKIKIPSSSQLNVNVTQTLFQAVSRAIDIFRDSSHNCENGTRMKNVELMSYAPYWLQNETGVALRYWLLDEGYEVGDDFMNLKTLPAKGPSIITDTILKPGCSVALNVKNKSPSKGRTMSSSDKLKDTKTFGRHHRMICVQLEGTHQPSVPMSIDFVGSRSFDVYFSHPHQGISSHKSMDELNSSAEEIQVHEAENNTHVNVPRTPVIFEVSAHHYSKLVRIYSTVMFVNGTSIPIEVGFDIPFGIPKVMDPVSPGEVRALPVHLAMNGKIRCRPTGGSHLWSETQQLSSLILPSRPGMFRSMLCYPAHHRNETFRCCISMNQYFAPYVETRMGIRNSSLGQERKDAMNVLEETAKPLEHSDLGAVGVREIVLLAPLVFKNWLPVPLSLSIRNDSGVNFEVLAPKCDSVSVFKFNPSQDLSLSISASGFTTITVSFIRATSLSLDGKDSSVQRRSRILEKLMISPDSGHGGHIWVSIEKVVDLSCGARELSVFVPHWLCNYGGFKLGIMPSDIESTSDKEQEILLDDYKQSGSCNFASSDNIGLCTILQPTESTNVSEDSYLKSVDSYVGKSFGFVTKGLTETNRLHRYKKRVDQMNQNDILSSNVQMNSEIETEGGIKAYMYSPLREKETMHKVRTRVVYSDGSFTSWSEPFFLNPPGGFGTVIIHNIGDRGAIILSVTSAFLSGGCAGRTTTVTFRPRYVLVNACKKALYIKQQGTNVSLSLQNGQQSQLHWADRERPLLVSVRYDEQGWGWSGGFTPEEIGDTLLKLRNHATGAMQMLRIEVQHVNCHIDGSLGMDRTEKTLGTYAIFLSEDATGFMPYRIDNFTKERLRFYQPSCERFESILLPYSSSPYAWDEPCQQHRLVLEIPGEGCLGIFSLDEVKDIYNVQLSPVSQRNDQSYLVSIHAEGPIMVLSVQDTAIHLGKCLDSTSNQVHLLQSSDSHFTVDITLSISSIGLSIIDLVPQEIVFVCAQDVSLQFLEDADQQKLNFQVSVFQLDNQLQHGHFPVMLYMGSREPLRSNVQNKLGVQPSFAHEAALVLTVVKWRHLESSVDCFQQIQVSVAPLQLQLEEQVVLCLLEFFQNLSSANGRSLLANSGDSIIDTGDDDFLKNWAFRGTMDSGHVHFLKHMDNTAVLKCWPQSQAIASLEDLVKIRFKQIGRAKKVYVELLSVSTVNMTVSYSSTPWLAKEYRGAAAQSLLSLMGASVQRGLMALVDIEKAPVHFRQLSVAHPLASWEAIWTIITRHYTRQILHEIYKVLGSAGVFGNPMAFLRILGDGIKDFISAPAQSLSQSPSQLGKGIALGTQSLVSNTVFALSNSATQMSKTARKGVAALTSDQKYSSVKEHNQFQANGVLDGVLEGLTGLLQSPVTGVETHGILGILSGLAVGAVGLVARPIASILEIAGTTAQSIRTWSSPNMLHIRRKRPPRYLCRDGPLVPYSLEEAAGNAFLKEAAGAVWRDLVYITCKSMSKPGSFVLLTETMLIIMKSVSVATACGDMNLNGEAEWIVMFQVPLEDILLVDRKDKDVIVFFGLPTRLSSRKRIAVSQSGPLRQECIEMVSVEVAEQVANALTNLVHERGTHLRRFITS